MEEMYIVLNESGRDESENPKRKKSMIIWYMRQLLVFKMIVCDFYVLNTLLIIT